MAVAMDRLRSALARLDDRVAPLAVRAGRASATAIDRWRTDAAAALFHLSATSGGPVLLAVLGGTGTGKSTLVNRLVGADVSATSFRRTFTSGPVAVVSDPSRIPEAWLGVPHLAVNPAELPARGQVGRLTVVSLPCALTERVVLVDTPDLDGDQPAHLAEADRVFRWAQAALFVVTPEKYQMTELLPYYRLARRYGVPARFVMNKTEEAAVLEDFRDMLARREWPDAEIFAVPRDDAAYEPPAQCGFEALARTLGKTHPIHSADPAGTRLRCRDLAERLRDQVLGPLYEDRRRIEQLAAALRALSNAPPGVDVTPLTQGLQRRMQEQSVLYLMGPGRMIDRARQLPGILARLPRTAWGYVVRGEHGGLLPSPAAEPQGAPDFSRIMSDQLTVVQSRIDDLLRSDADAARWLDEGPELYRTARIDAGEAARIAEEEIAELRAWLEQRWEAAPRDTQVIQKLIGYLPGGKRVTRWSEAAPYLLAVAVAAHGAVFGPIDLMIIGGWTLATWLGEKLSNEVTARTRAANRRIGERFDALAREQVDKVIAWLEIQAPTATELDRAARAADEVSEATAPMT